MCFPQIAYNFLCTFHMLKVCLFSKVHVIISICTIMYLFVILVSENRVLEMIAGGTPYENGIFRMKLVLSSDFPRSPPKGLAISCVPLIFSGHRESE